MVERRRTLDDETAADFMRRINAHQAAKTFMRTVGIDGRVDVFIGNLSSSQMIGKRAHRGKRDAVVQIAIMPFKPGDEIPEEK